MGGWGYRKHGHMHKNTKKAQRKDHFLSERNPIPEPHFKVKYEKVTRRFCKHLVLTDTYAVRQMTREAVIA